MAKDSRINIRADTQVIQRLKDAAYRRHVSLTTFMLYASTGLADQILGAELPTEVHASEPVREVVKKAQIAPMPEPEEEWVYYTDRYGLKRRKRGDESQWWDEHNDTWRDDGF